MTIYYKIDKIDLFMKALTRAPVRLIAVFLLIAGRQLVLETLYALTSNTKIITEAMNKGQRDIISCRNTPIADFLCESLRWFSHCSCV